MQVGPLETPFGLSVFDKQGPPKYSVDLKLRGYDDPTNHPKTATIYNAFHALDEFMLDQGVKNSAAWFKGTKSREVLSELYTPVVRFSVDSDGNRKPYPPTLKVQLRKRDDKFEADVYDENKRSLNDIPLEDIIVKGTVLTALIQCTGVWLTAASRFAALPDDDDEEVNDDEALAPPATASATAPVEEDDEEAPIPVPQKAKTMTAAKVVKKVVKKAA